MRSRFFNQAGNTARKRFVRTTFTIIMAFSSDTLIASLDRQLAEFQGLKDLVTEQVHLVEEGEFDSLQTSCARMMQLIDQIDRASVSLSSLPVENAGTVRVRKDVGLRLSRLKKLIGEIEAIRVDMIGRLVDVRQVLQEEMHQLTTGVTATKQYYKPQEYRGARYFDRSQ
ncbi:MAG: hypothetical protein HY709_01800 [Candidatus Latescibacteria bacterium]|nr:hypothetical protein [Candidatus Latescibacterota bacterium]